MRQRHPHRITAMATTARLVPAAAPLLALALLLTACDGGVHGTPGGSGVHDPYFPKAGNGGAAVAHYALRLAYDPAHGPAHAGRLTGTATLTARATKDLSAFDLDFKGLK